MVDAGPVAGIPPLSISAGPSAADGQVSGAATGATGEFFFGGRRTEVTDVAKAILPALVIGGVIWWALNR